MNDAFRFIRYVLVGGTIGVLWLVTLYGLVAIGLPQSAASVIGFCMCMPLAYMGHRKITFRSKGRITAEAMRFMLKSLIGLGLSAAVPAIVSGLRLPLEVTAVGTPAAVALTGFLLARYWVYYDSTVDPQT